MISDADLAKLKNRLFFPFLSLLTPFTPIAIYPEHPITFIFLAWMIWDFFSGPGMIARRYIERFGILYWAIFIGSLILRIALELLNDPMIWLSLIFIVPVTLIFLGGYVWRKMEELYRIAEERD